MLYLPAIQNNLLSECSPVQNFGGCFLYGWWVNFLYTKKTDEVQSGQKNFLAHLESWPLWILSLLYHSHYDTAHCSNLLLPILSLKGGTQEVHKCLRDHVQNRTPSAHQNSVSVLLISSGNAAHFWHCCRISQAKSFQLKSMVIASVDVVGRERESFSRCCFLEWGGEWRECEGPRVEEAVRHRSSLGGERSRWLFATNFQLLVCVLWTPGCLCTPIHISGQNSHGAPWPERKFKSQICY